MTHNKMERQLRFLDIFCLASGAMISSGIFILPGMAFSQAGPLVFISYLLAGILALTGTLSIIELSTAMPKAGGDYFFITRSLGPFIGTMSSFLSWTALCLKSAFAIFGIAEILYLALGIPLFASSLALCIFFVILNILGVKESAKFQVLLVTGLFAIMLFFIVGAVSSVSEQHFIPLVPHGFNKILVTAGFVFISFGGLLNIASISGEVKDPSKNIPRGMIASVLSVTFLYTAILIVTIGVLPSETLIQSLTPVADAGEILFGKTGYIVIAVGALLAFITTANAGIMSASRYPLALSEDHLLPKVLGKLTRRNRSPWVAVLITGFFISICLLLDITTLVKLGSIVILTLYILTNTAVIILREGKIQNYRPAFKVPFYPWINIIGIIIFLLLIIDMGLVAVEFSFGIVSLAVILYVFYGRSRHKIEYALLHLIERVINKKITSTKLEEELKEVILNRDNIIIDRFHSLINTALVLNLTEKITLDDFFDMLSQKIAPDIGLSTETTIRLLQERETDGVTAITPFVAIPHIIIPGKNLFRLVIVRAREGISFSEENNSIKAVFALFGTKDERTFHLEVLSAIAHIIHDRNFEESWLSAKDEHQLRDLLLLSKRKRFNK